jgi:hypothetical protein
VRSLALTNTLSLDLAAQAEAPLSSTVSVTPGDSIKIDVSTPAEVDSPAASPVWTYSPAWTPTWPIWSPTNPSSPVVLTRFGEDSTEAPAVAPIEDPISVVPVVTTDVPVIPQVVTNAPATYAPATSAPIVHSNFHFPGKMVHHDEVWVAPGTVAPLTADPIIDVDTLDTRGGELIDAAEELHASLVEEVTPEGSFVSKLQIETDTLVINFGGPGLDLTAVEAIMYEKLVTLLTIFYAAEIGPIFESFDLSLNFSEEIINEATGEVIVTDTSEATTVVIGSVEVGTIINLATASSINLLGIDEAYATNILRSFFDGEYLQKLLNELDGVNMGLSFMELETSDSYVEAIATHNVGETSTETASTALIAGALAGVLVFVTGAALATRRWKSNDDDDLSQLFEEEDQLYPLSNQQDGAASTIGFPTAEDIEEEDSMGSDSFLDWAQPDRPRSSRITSGRIRDDMDGDLFPVDL